MHESPEDGRGSFRGYFIVGRNGERSLAVTRKYFFERATCTGTTVVKDRDAFVIKAACAFACDPRNADIKSPTLKNVRSRVSKRVSLFRLIIPRSREPILRRRSGAR